MRRETPFRFNPRGVVDATDGGAVPPGGLLALTNLIFDPANFFTFVCRPAAIKTSSFATFSSPGVVSIAYVVGDICYGLVASAANSGHDEPFAYNLATNAFVSVGGTITSATTPTTPSTSGAWTPPCASLVGTRLIITHPGFATTAKKFGWFDTSNPASPTWNSGNTTTTLLPSVPTAVGQLGLRAWFAIGNALYFTDILTLAISDATHIVTVGDNEAITALAPLPIKTSVQGIIQSLAVFKRKCVALITGDAAQDNLADNIISSTIGTRAPRSVVVTPDGIKFMDDDGIRLLTQDGTISDADADLQQPFMFAANPSRVSGCYNNSIYRICTQNDNANGSPYQEYWYDYRRKGWTGPHSFRQDLAVPYQATTIIFNSNSVPGLWTSDVVQSGTSTFTENGSALSWLWRTAPLQDDGSLYEGSAVLSVIDMQLPNNGESYTFSAIDVNHGVLASGVITASLSGSTWGTLTWGLGLWNYTNYGLDRYNIPWSAPLAFSRLIIQGVGVSAEAFKIGKLTVGNQPTKYVRTS